jgi:protein-disulfide isomerase
VSETERAGPNKVVMIALGALVAVGVAAGIYYYRGGFNQDPKRVADKDKTDPDVAVLMAPGPLPDIVIGSADAPGTIVEYASMTCPHCAQFQTEVFPKVKAKYIDTGKARYILREFPLDNLAAAAFMLARCSGNDRYYPMVDALFSTQESWAVPGVDAKEKLLQIARQAGISKEEFDKCLSDKDLFGKIVQTREIAHDKFQVDSTPTFFINGKRLKGDHQLNDFEVAFGDAPSPAPADADKAKPEGAPAAAAPPAPPPAADADKTKPEEAPAAAAAPPATPAPPPAADADKTKPEEAPPAPPAPASPPAQ